MIKTFKCKETEKVFNGYRSRTLPSTIQENALRKLFMIHAASNINELRMPPSNCLKRLKGARKDQYCIRINNQWRICFNWEDQHAQSVEIIDYH